MIEGSPRAGLWAAGDRFGCPITYPRYPRDFLPGKCAPLSLSVLLEAPCRAGPAGFKGARIMLERFRNNGVPS